MSENNDNKTENQIQKVNQPKHKKQLKFGKADENETDLFVKLLKQWLTKHNKIEDSLEQYDKPKLNFTRKTIFIDYIEMSIKCPTLCESMLLDFVRFSKFLQNLTKRILVSSNLMKEESTIFNDIILLNYPDIIDKINIQNFTKIIQTNPKRGGILGFNKAFVIKIKAPTFLLWSKKIFFQCDCKGDKLFLNKFFNIFKFKSNTEKNFNNNLYETFCDVCRKEYIQDKNSEVFIQCQEIQVSVAVEENCLINNLLTVWAYGDFINSVKEGDVISLIAFYMPNDMSNFFEKNFEYGHFVALNFNKFFEPLVILKEDNFHIEFPTNIIENILNQKKREKFSGKFNEDCEIDILRSVKFQRQLITNMNKLLFNTFINNNKNDSQLTNNSNDTFLKIALDLSLVQRDYLNKVNKIVFFDQDKLDKSKNKITIDNSGLNQSRNLLFKTKIFEKTDFQEKQQEEVMRNFRLTRQTDYDRIFYNSQQYSLTKPLNIFLIFDDLNVNNNLNVNTIYNYRKKYSNLIQIYPFINIQKFNKENIIKFFITCHNGIVIIPDVELLNKNEVELIFSIMNNSMNEYEGKLNLNISFWILSNYYKLTRSGKKGKTGMNSSLIGEVKNKLYKSLVDECEIILNYSKFFNSMRGVEIESKKMMINSKSNFISDYSLDLNVEEFANMKLEKCNNNFNNNYLIKKNLIQDLTLLKQFHHDTIIDNIKLCNDNHFFSKSQNEDFDDSLSSAKLMEDYFIIKRNLSNVNFDDLVK